MSDPRGILFEDLPILRAGLREIIDSKTPSARATHEAFGDRVENLFGRITRIMDDRVKQRIDMEERKAKK